MNESQFDHKNFLAKTTQKPGVYCMSDSKNIIIYVGKAKNLKKRLSSYFRKFSSLPTKTQALVAQIVHIETTITHTESEALILESTLIKKYQPRYNILLRDDKSYPYIYLSAHPNYPRLSLHRGSKREKGQYFGPYPHAKAVYESLHLMQILFPIRQCRDSFFRNRSRPCLQYQIKRCSAPCVGLIDIKTYQEEIQHATLFLQGKSQVVISSLVEKMQMAAQNLNYEKAAHYRDQINHLKKLQAHQYVSTEKNNNVDVIAAAIHNNIGCVQVLSIRDGRHLGSRAFFPKHVQESDVSGLLTAFLSQYYLGTPHDLPDEIILNQIIEEHELLIEAIWQQKNKKIQIYANVRGTKARWVEMAIENVQASLAHHQPSQYRERLATLTQLLQLELMPQRLECFDVSHSLGEATVASCVVFGEQGPIPSAYRRFNITNITPGDDYAALNQALKKRYTKLATHPENLPDLVCIDGGKKQVKVAQVVFEELQLNAVQIIGIVKGEGRKAALDNLIVSLQDKPLIVPKHSPALHLIQHLRDEAHRFAITAHRKKRRQQRQTSVLEQIEGIGAKRRQRLMNHFGGLQGITTAGVEDLASVPGINKQLAQKIYDFFMDK